MRLFSPFNLLFLLFIPIIIFMYILKQKFNPNEISSLYLWNMALKEIEVNTPWQRLKKNLLMFLQILFVILVALALSRPFISSGKGNYKNVVIVLDNSGSMETKYKNTTRFNEAKNKAIKLIDTLNPNTLVTVISAENSPRIEVNRSDDRKYIKDKINELEGTSTSGDLSDAFSLINGMLKEGDKFKTIIYTDNKIDTQALAEVNGSSVRIYSKEDNLSVDYVSYGNSEGGANSKLEGVVKVTNWSDKQLSTEVSLYSEDNLIDIKKIKLSPDSSGVLYYEGIPAKSKYIWAKIEKKDGLISDNKVYTPVTKNKIKKVLLVSSGNTFIERVISINKGIELYKTDINSEITGKYDLYIYDGCSPKKSIKNGNILLINPPDNNNLVETNGTLKGGVCTISNSNELTKYMNNTKFTVAKVKNIKAPLDSTPLLKINGKICSFATNEEGNKIAVIAFDLHDSDFVLTPQYPIFMNNLLSYLIDLESFVKQNYYSGETINIFPAKDAKSCYIIDPTSQKEKLNIMYPSIYYNNTKQPGIYKYSELGGKGERRSLFAVNFNPSEEKTTSVGYNFNSIKEEKTKKGAETGVELQSWKDIQPIIIMLMLLLLCIEWMVYSRDN